MARLTKRACDCSACKSRATREFARIVAHNFTRAQESSLRETFDRETFRRFTDSLSTPAISTPER